MLCMLCELSLLLLDLWPLLPSLYSFCQPSVLPTLSSFANPDHLLPLQPGQQQHNKSGYRQIVLAVAPQLTVFCESVPSGLRS